MKLSKLLRKTLLYIVSVAGVLLLGNGFLQILIIRNFMGAVLSFAIGVLFTAFGIKRLAEEMDPVTYVE